MGDHAEIYEKQFERIERVIGNFSDRVSYPVVVNFQRLVSLKTADLLFGEPPRIRGDESLERFVTENDIINKAYEAAIDVSRYGTGLFCLYRGEDGKPCVDTLPPSVWFPVMRADNMKQPVCHVLAFLSENGGESVLTARIHLKGLVVTRKLAVKNGQISYLTEDDTTLRTGFDGFAVIPVHNPVACGEHGVSDYGIIDSVVSEIEVRLSQISVVLDKHTNPVMTGPSAALTKDEFGQWVFKAGAYIPNDGFSLEGQPGEVKYVTWDAQLDANFKQLDSLLNFLYMLTETGPTLLGASENTGMPQSGTALRLKMIAPLAKVKRLRLKFDNALKRLLGLCYAMPMDEIAIYWQDGLPDDPKETAEIMNIRTGGKATISQKTAIAQLEHMAEEACDEEITAIRRDGKER
jgi:hypothetical protein